MSPPSPSSNQTDMRGQDSSDSAWMMLVDGTELQSFLREQQAIVNQQRLQAKRETQQVLHDRLVVAFEDCRSKGVSQFARWYFSYTTSYQLSSIAMKSAAKHTLTLGKDHMQTLQQAVARDLQLYICEKYQATVLRPALTDPKIHRALTTSLEQLHTQVYEPALLQLETSVQQLAKRGSKNLDAEDQPPSAYSSFSIPPNAIVLELDWRAQLQKAQHLATSYEKNPPEFSLALIGGSTVAGKAIGGTAVKAVAAKLAVPFASKAAAATVGGKAAAGAAGGVVAGGPLGAGMGAVIGIGMDMAVNQGVSLLQRPAFENDVRESLDATLLEWEERLLPEIDRVVQDQWFGQLDAVLQDDLLIRYRYKVQE